MLVADVRDGCAIREFPIRGSVEALTIASLRRNSVVYTSIKKNC